MSRSLGWLILSLSLTGCGSILTTWHAEQLGSRETSKRSYCHSVPSVYAGAAYDLCASIFSRPGEVDGNAISAGHMLDLPLSLAGDTLLLPYTLTRQLRHGNLPLQREAR